MSRTILKKPISIATNNQYILQRYKAPSTGDMDSTRLAYPSGCIDVQLRVCLEASSFQQHFTRLVIDEVLIKEVKVSRLKIHKPAFRRQICITEIIQEYRCFTSLLYNTR